jgi:hypothetical protein
VVDTDLLLLKAGNVRRHLARVRTKCGAYLDIFLADQDLVDIVCFNLQTDFQNCLNMGAHIVSEKGTPVPGSL